jgi:hypothetical protein
MWFSDSSILCKVLHSAPAPLSPIACPPLPNRAVTTRNDAAAAARRRQQQDDRGGRLLLAARSAAAAGVLSNKSRHTPGVTHEF